MEGGGGRRVGWGREGPLWMAGASIHGVREDLALAVAHEPRDRGNMSLTRPNSGKMNKHPPIVWYLSAVPYVR